MADFIYTKGMLEMLRGSANGIDWVGDTVQCILLEAAATEDKDDEFVGDVAGFDELDDASYARVNISSKTLSANLTDDRVEADHGDITFSSLAGGEDITDILYAKDGANDAARRLIGHWDTFSGITTNGSNVVVSSPAAGAFYMGV